MLSPKDTPGYEEYVKALLEYKQECKKFKRLSLRYKMATAPAERLMFLEAKEQYKIACKVYSDARFKYAAALATAREQLKPETNEQLVLKAAARGVQIPMSMSEIIQAQRDTVHNQYWEEHPEEFEKMKAAALAYMNKDTKPVSKSASVSVKEEFMTSEYKDVVDPTLGDFEPI